MGGDDSLLVNLQMDKMKFPKHLYSFSEEFFLDFSTWNQSFRRQLYSVTTHPFNVIVATSKMPFDMLINSKSIYYKTTGVPGLVLQDGNGPYYRVNNTRNSA